MALSPALGIDIPSAINRRAIIRERAVAIQGAFREHEFTIDTTGPGLTSVKCVFGYAFTRQPSLHAGVAIQEGDVVIGSPPTINAVVTGWTRSDQGLYLAARVAVRLSGHRRQRLTTSLVFAGMGLTYPLASSLENLSMNDPL